MKTGLFFGSFNPVHNGHLIVAEQMLEAAGLDAIWFVLSPQNPFKQQQHLLNQHQRLALLQKAIAGNPRFSVCDAEFHLPVPSYTIDTMRFLEKEYPAHRFHIIMGSDNLQGFEKWKEAEIIQKNYPILVYRRGDVDSQWQHVADIQLFDLPYIHISATSIREAVAANKSIRYLVPETIEEEVKALYKPL